MPAADEHATDAHHQHPGGGLTRAGSASSSSSLPIFCSACRPCLNSLSWRSTSVKRTDMAAAAHWLVTRNRGRWLGGGKSPACCGAAQRCQPCPDRCRIASAGCEAACGRQTGSRKSSRQARVQQRQGRPLAATYNRSDAAQEMISVYSQGHWPPQAAAAQLPLCGRMAAQCKSTLSAGETPVGHAH